MGLRTHLGRGIAVAILAFGIVAIQPGSVAAAEEDQDLDGVADTADACPDTPEGAVTTADGCTACPCDGPTAGSVWESRGSFLACITDAVRGRKQARAMSRRGARAAIKAARKSSCGDANLTRCCVFPSDSGSDTIVGKCKVVTVDQCDQMSEQLEWAEDADPGSCLPNPCVF